MRGPPRSCRPRLTASAGAPSTRLADRRRVLDAALRPQRVDAAGDLQLRSRADIALKHLVIIAEMIDDVVGPIIGEADALAEGAVEAEQAANVLVLRAFHCIDIGLADPELLGVEKCEVDPLDD